MSKLLDYTRRLLLLWHHCRAFLSPLLFSAPLPYSLIFATTSESSFFSFTSPVFHGNFSTGASDSGNDGKKEAREYPSGEFELREFNAWEKFRVRYQTLIALPWEYVPKGSVLTMKLRGQIIDQLKTPFVPALSLPQICENFVKAAYDPRISGVYLQIEGLKCGWGKFEEMRRHILDFRKSGKFIVAYLPFFGEKEYYLACACEELYAPPSAYFRLYGLTVEALFLGGTFEKVGVEPQVERIGKYKMAGDQLMCKSISQENREMLTTLLDSIYGNWLEKISAAKGKRREDVEKLIDEGIYQIERLKEEGWITDISYEDEVILPYKMFVTLVNDNFAMHRLYSGVRNWTFGLSGGKEQIAVIRASGSIKLFRESKRYKAVVIQIDSPGIASDLLWTEIRLLAAKKPVIASLADVAASGGYYISMAARTIVAENLTLTGSIGVVKGKFSLGKLYEKIGVSKEIISRGKYAELTAAEQRPSEEAELFAKLARYAYTQFRDQAAYSRSIPVDKMEENAQGRVLTGSEAVSRGLVDAIGGMSRAVAIVKQKANISPENNVPSFNFMAHWCSCSCCLSVPFFKFCPDRGLLTLHRCAILCTITISVMLRSR
ncbi:hypothetical protein Cgig2_003538 [Carnegiea gigantea]|uniref:Peptidase S49 domain-containing protein n=1 Tax=Carnegiea gigantea TaxID=171969 RepID=A0A9Q1JTW1_9CARY|nr:hypothetical protein Cgig2_003538 [Carnegiea gigantea]